MSLLGIDIANDSFRLRGADRSGKPVYKKRLARSALADSGLGLTLLRGATVGSTLNELRRFSSMNAGGGLWRLLVRMVAF